MADNRPASAYGIGVELFTRTADRDPSLLPLAERLRPRTLDEVVGQEHLVGPGTLLRRAIEQDRLPSMILWGPPGVGKTTIARLIANHTRCEFVQLSAVLSGVKDIREVVERAEERRALHRRRTLLFVDEIHRFNRSQQDALLPHVERGLLILVGATTENPSFEVNAALLSRARVFVLRALDETAVRRLLERALSESDASRTDLSTRVAKLQETVDQYRIKPKNAASLVDGRVVDVSDQDGQVFLSIGAKQRLQPGMVFDVYDSAAAVQFDPGSGELIPGKARLQILKVEDDTSTARVIPEDRRSGGRAPRPVVKDDVIANAIYSPEQRYRFLVHGKFDVDNDGRATAAEADFVRSRIQRWGGDVVEGDSLSGDLDFIVMGVKPMKPFELPPNADASQYSAYHEQQKAFQDYESLFRDAQTARIPVLNWNRMQVLTNEGR